MDSEHPEFTNPFEHGRRLPRHDASTRMEPQRSGYYPTQPLGRQQIQNGTDIIFHPCKLLKADDTIASLQHCAIYL